MPRRTSHARTLLEALLVEQTLLLARHLRRATSDATGGTGDQLGPGWRRMAGRFGLRDPAAVTVIAGEAKWIRNQDRERVGGGVVRAGGGL